MTAKNATTKTRGGRRKGAGRPPLPPGEKVRRVLITLPPAMDAWLAAQPDGKSGTIQRLIALAMR